MAAINFDQYNQQILDALQAKIFMQGLIQADPLGFTLLEGFINMPLQKEIGGAFIIGGQTIPAVAIVGKSTGVIHTFALKALLPNIQI